MTNQASRPSLQAMIDRRNRGKRSALEKEENREKVLKKFKKNWSQQLQEKREPTDEVTETTAGPQKRGRGRPRKVLQTED